MQRLVNGMTTGIIAGASIWVCAYFSLLAWALFLAWLGYFLHGATLRAGAQMLLSMIAGIVIASIIVLVSAILTPTFGAMSLPLTVAAAAGSMTLLEGHPPFDSIPAYYMGMVAFFAAGARPEFNTAIALMVPATLGVFCGWACVQARSISMKSKAAVSDDEARMARVASPRQSEVRK